MQRFISAQERARSIHSVARCCQALLCHAARDALPFGYRFGRYLDALVLKRKDAEMQAERKRKQQACNGTKERH
jgi:hypothetical protein